MPAEVFRLWAIAWKAGRYISMASGPRAVSSPIKMSQGGNAGEWLRVIGPSIKVGQILAESLNPLPCAEHQCKPMQWAKGRQFSMGQAQFRSKCFRCEAHDS